MYIAFFPNKYIFNTISNKTYKNNAVSFGMKEDIFAKQRNGHALIDTFDKTTNRLDIRSNGLYPANVLSNLANNEFVYDGVHCGSIEGFLQSLKTEDTELQREICLKYGGSAKDFTKKLASWKDSGILYWQGKEFKRDSKEFFELVLGAYKALYEQNSVYRTALKSTIGSILTHTSGKDKITETILTKEEFISILNKLRKI